MTTASTVPATARPVADSAAATTSNRRFLGKAWGILVGIKDALVLVFMLLFFIAIFAILSGRPNAAAVRDGALVLDLAGVVSEQPADPAPFAALQGPVTRQFRARDIVRAVEHAASDDKVKVIVLDLDRFLGGGQVTLERIGTALDTARKAGKPVLAYATAYSDDSYALAAHASEIWVDPMGGALFTGPGGSRLYYKGLMDKLGIEAKVYRVGTFKSAVEPYIRSDQSPAARTMNQAYADTLWEQWLAHVVAARPRAKIAAFTGDPAGAVEGAGGDLAKAVVAAGLVDKTGNRIAFGRRVANLAGVGPDKDRPWKFASIRLDDYLAANDADDSGDEIAVVPVVGTIVDGKAGAGTAGGTTIATQILDVVARGDAKAIVLRVDSPGGSALASEEIRQALMSARAKGLPVVVSMANVAASGGFWVSTASDRIFAEPDTITGSIGVFGIIPTFSGSLDKLGIGADGVTTTPLSGQPDIFGGTSEQFDRVVQASIENIYGKFTGIVAANRKLPVERVREIAEGRVWSGGAARQLGLIDAFGGLDEAMAAAAKLAKLDPAKVHATYYEPQPDAFAAMLADLFASDQDDEPEARGMLAVLGARHTLLAARAVSDVERLVAEGGSVQADCFECRSLVATAAPDATRLSGLWSRLWLLVAR
ncbi:signal peptide peptidase SppA [Sphingorhabdus soli]|uniref:Signal peptide peptidase SppA n=1 Tax=Flavisphingopyxis soli TaxID=2601267 RepID=A0A5C6U472_9SPHN|nr:signal peptide peptidase SppA [Sphingorhabdus soli]TXC67772.1 signal peptide peptidase SppA [Sphingorhabdus soli]